MDVQQEFDNKAPELLYIPVYRDVYLSQARTDELCKLLWDKDPELIFDLGEECKKQYPDCRIDKFRSLIRVLQKTIRDEEKLGNIKPISYIGMVDLCWEVDRRLRKALGIEELELYGKQIAVSERGPFPDWPKKKMSQYAYKGMTQEISDTLTKKVYAYLIEHQPEVLFACSESHRRNLQVGESDDVIDSISQELTPTEYKLRPEATFSEFMHRFLHLTYGL